MGCKESRQQSGGCRVRVEQAGSDSYPSSVDHFRLSSGKSLLSQLDDEVVRVTSAKAAASLNSAGAASVGDNAQPPGLLPQAKGGGGNGGLFAPEDDFIPTIDFGESLDCRRGGAMPKTMSAQSTDSVDSGIYDLDEEYSFVITERSAPELVAKVHNDFIAVENLELIVTGRACPRLLSGVQKSRLQEQLILKTLREEGLISKPANKATGGLSFEIVDTRAATAVGNLPPMQLQKLEERRMQLKKPTASTLEERLEKAEERRKQLEEERLRRATAVERVTEKQEMQREELRTRQSEKFEAALEKREEHLRNLRDKLKEKHSKGASIRLKKVFNQAPIPTVSANVDMDDDFFS